MVSQPATTSSHSTQENTHSHKVKLAPAPGKSAQPTAQKTPFNLVRTIIATGQEAAEAQGTGQVTGRVTGYVVDSGEGGIYEGDWVNAEWKMDRWIRCMKELMGVGLPSPDNWHIFNNIAV